MKKMTLSLSLTILILAGLLFISPRSARARESCRVCGMYLDVYRQTAAHLVDKDGHESGTCGVTDLIRFIVDAGGPEAFGDMKVKDFNNGTMIDAAGAAFVIGSDTVPDMLPNIIAFAGGEDARAFARDHGGKVISFSQALLSISPMAMTMPARLKAATIPGRGATMAGIGHMKMVMDEIALGSDSIDPAEFISRPMQMMGAKKMTSEADMFMASHSVSDSDNIAIRIVNLKKEMEMYTMGGMGVSTKKNSGIGDIELSLRHGLWRNTFHSRFLTATAAINLPTGDFDPAFVASPGMQTGHGALAATAGMLYSQRMGDFWLHSSLSYKHFLENSDDYQFGDLTRTAAALHYTPNYNTLVGVEIDANWWSKNEYRGVKQDNTGGFRAFATAIASWKFLTALGGNFSAKGTYGVPVYEDMNHYRAGMAENAQMGGGYMSSISLNFKRRFNY